MLEANVYLQLYSFTNACVVLTYSRTQTDEVIHQSLVLEYFWIMKLIHNT